VNMGELNTILGELGHIRRDLQALALSVAGCQAKCQNDLARRKGWIVWVGGVITALVPAALVLLARR